MRKCLFLLLVITCSGISGQQLIGKWVLEKDRTLLRWAIVDSTTFRRAFKMGYILERVEDDSLFSEPGKVKRFLIFPDSMGHPQWENLAKSDPRVLFVYQLFFSFKPFPSPLLHMAAAAADQNFSLACSMGWGFIDSTIQSGRNYYYRIRVSGVKEMPLLKKVSDLTSSHVVKVKQSGKKIQLNWNVKKERPLTAGYFIEKRISGRTFESLNKIPVLELRNPASTDSLLYYEDSVVRNETKYEYRLRACDHFGRFGPWSEIVSINYYDPVEGDIRITGADRAKDQLIVKCDADPKLKVNYFLSKNVSGPFEPLILLHSGNELYLTPVPSASCYFKVCAYSRAGDSICSLPYYYFVPDTIPPDPPSDFKAKVRSNGIVDLDWRRSSDKKCIGYRLFRSNAKKDEFTEVNTKIISGSCFSDTLSLASLNKYVWYFLRAIDSLYNNSMASDTIKVVRPDTIPPPAPVITQLNSMGHWISMHGIAMNSNEDSVFAEIKGEKVFKTVSLVPDSGHVDFTDSFPHPGQYSIRLVAKDLSGNKSFSHPRYFSLKNATKVRPNFDSIRVEREQRYIALRWSSSNEIWSITLYRGKNNAQLTPLITLAGNTTEYTDRQLFIGNIYSYQLVVILRDGTKLLSPEHIITY